MTHHPVSRLDRFLHGLLWGLAVVLIPLALLVGLGRELLPLVSGQKQAMERLLSEKTGLQVRLGALEGDWHALNPILRAREVALHDPRHPGQALLVVPSVTTEPDWWATLRDLSPRLRTTIHGLKLTLAPGVDGGVEVVELASLGKSDPAKARRVLHWLLAQPGLALLDNQLRWRVPGQPVQALRDVRLQQFKKHGDYRLQAEFRLGDSNTLQRALIVVAGDPLNWRQTPWHAYLQIEDLPAWQPWLSLLPESWDARLRQGGLKLWLASPGGQPADITLALRDVGLDLTPPKRGPQEISGLRGVLSVQRRDGHWRLGADDLAGRVNGLDLPLQRLAANYGDGRLVLSGARVSLDGLRTLAVSQGLLPAAWQSRLEEMRPVGWLPRVQIRAEQGEQGWTLHSLGAEFKALTVQATTTLPGVRNLAGWVQGGADGGLLYLDTRGGELNLHNMLREPVPVDVLRGGVRWLRRDKVWHVDTDVLQLANVDAEGRLQMTVRLPEGRPQDARLDLLAGLSRGDVARAWRYVPWHSAGDHTLAWLRRALVAGRIDRGAFLYSGTLHGPAHTGRFDMDLRLKGATLDYVPGWPAVQRLDGSVRITGRELVVEAERAQIMGARASRLRASIPDLRQSVLQVESDLDMDLGDLDRLLAESPLKSHTARTAEMLALKGPVQAHLGLRIPLRHGAPEVRVDAMLRDAEVALPGQRLQLSSVNGPLGFDSVGGLKGTLTGNLWGQPARVALTGEARAGHWWRQKIEVDARADSTSLGRWLNADLSPYLRGSAPVRVSLDLPMAATGQTDLRVHSSLQGMRLLLPAPFAKPAETSLPLTYQGKLGTGEHLARATLGDGVQAGMAWRDGSLHRLLLRAGLPGLAWPDQAGLFVEARVAELDVTAWQALAGRGQQPAARAPLTGLPALRQLTLQSERIVAGEQVFGPTRARVQRADNGWQVRLSGMQPRKLPNWPATEVTTTLSQEQGQWRLDPLELRQPQATFTGSLAWLASGRGQTVIKGALESRDLKRLLEQLGQAPAISSDSVLAKAQLQWPGEPADFAISRLQGNLDVRLRNGRLAEAGGINLATRIFGLLNASNILRRLRFDFTDVTRKGINFDQLTAQGELHEGMVKPAVFDLEGPSVTIRGRGWVNLETHELDQQLRVGVPVSSAVPVVAGFLAGPVVGGALVAADLLLDKQLSRLTSVRYRVTGSWDAPRVENEMLEPTTDKSDKGGKDKDGGDQPPGKDGGQ